MTAHRDEQLTYELSRLYAQAGIPVDVEVRDGVAQISGRVSSPEIHQAAIDLALMVNGIRDVDDQMDYEVISPDSAFESPDDDEEFGYADEWSLRDDLSDTEGDFSGDVGADSRDFQQAIEEGEPYFPPTDPVVRPSRSEEELDVVGGFQNSSTDETAWEPDAIPGEELEGTDLYSARDDEDIRDDVLRELREDALTTALNLSVTVVNGVVFLRGTVESVEDAENAESVAAQVPGVIEVRDLTTVEGEE